MKRLSVADAGGSREHWVRGKARLCRPELAYRCSSLQGRQSKPLNRAAQKTSMNGIRFQKGIFKFSEAVILSVTDASHAAELHVSHIGKESGHKSHTRRMILLADRMPAKSVSTCASSHSQRGFPYDQEGLQINTAGGSP